MEARKEGTQGLHGLICRITSTKKVISGILIINFFLIIYYNGIHIYNEITYKSQNNLNMNCMSNASILQL